MLRAITRFKLACKELYRDVLPFTATETVPRFLFRRPEFVDGHGAAMAAVVLVRPQVGEKTNVPLTIVAGTGFSSTSEKLSTPCDPTYPIEPTIPQGSCRSIFRLYSIMYGVRLSFHSHPGLSVILGLGLFVPVVTNGVGKVGLC